MSQHILVPVDGSDPSYRALEYSLTLFPTTPHVVLYVRDPNDDSHGSPESGDWQQRATRRAERAHRQAQEVAGRHNRKIKTVQETGSPHRKILEYARQDNIGHVCIASTGRARIPNLRLGSVSGIIVRRSPTSVTIVRASSSVRGPSANKFHSLVGVNESQKSRLALSFAVSELPASECTAMYVSTELSRSAAEAPEGTYVEDLRNKAHNKATTALEEFIDDLSVDRESITTRVEFGRPDKRLVDAAQESTYDHLVVGAGTRRGGRHGSISNVAESVARESPIPITVAR